MKKTINKWQAIITIYFPIEMEVEDGETAEDIREWLKSPKGKDYIADLMPKHIHGSERYPFAEAKLEGVDDICLKEYEVSSYDTDPRV